MELNADREFGEFQGYSICASFICALLETIDITYTYEQLINAKSRINELFLGLKDPTRKLKYSSIKNIEDATFISTVSIGGRIMGSSDMLSSIDAKYSSDLQTYRTPFRKKVLAEKAAAEVAIYNLIQESKYGSDENLTEAVEKMSIKKALNPFGKTKKVRKLIRKKKA